MPDQQQPGRTPLLLERGLVDQPPELGPLMDNPIDGCKRLGPSSRERNQPVAQEERLLEQLANVEPPP